MEEQPNFLSQETTPNMYTSLDSSRKGDSVEQIDPNSTYEQYAKPKTQKANLENHIKSVHLKSQDYACKGCDFIG